MDPDRWRKLQALCESALAVEPGRRVPFLEENCRGDESLRREAELLVLHGENAGHFVNAPALPPLPEVGRRVCHYEIQEKIGEGGMGAVYKALDTRLGRAVALKFIHSGPDIDEDSRAALVNEARAASALDHPNIGTIYGIEDTSDGQKFIVMACYEGQTLAQKLKSGPLPVKEAAMIALQAASGLAEAHRHKIIHRDIKPSNIFLTRQGLAKVLDFGIARVAPSATSTLSVNIPGTPVYMSPEQAQGRFLDARTDLWSLGAVLYEMITGRRAFAADGIPATLFAIVHEPPRALEDDIPPVLQKTVYRALAKRPEDRYESAAEMIQDLRCVAGAPGQESDPTVTFGKLGKYSRLATDRKRRPYARWRFILPLLAVILAGIAVSIRPSVPKAAARQSYLKAVACIRDYDKPGNLDQAISLLTQSVKAEPDSALTFASLGQAYCLKARLAKDPSLLPMAEANATRAVKLDSALAKVHVVMGEIQRFRGNSDLALEELHEALKLEPLNAEARFGLARVYEAQGRKREAEEDYRRAADMRPDSWEGYNSWGLFLSAEGRLPEAAEQFRQVLKLSPESPVGNLNLGIVYKKQGRLDDAETLLKNAQRLDPSSYVAPANLGVLYYTKRLFPLAVESHKRALALNPRDWRAWKNLAITYRWLNQDAAAVSAYQQAIPLLESEVRTTPPNGLRQARLAEMYAYCGEHDKAETWIRAARATAPRDPEVLLSCADACAAMGDRRRAVEIAAEAVANGLTLSSLREDPEARRFKDDPMLRFTDR